jgi:sugar/nucleoside kinase (ribokinase family)
MTIRATHSPAFDVVGFGANSVDFVNLLPAYPQQHGPFAKMRIRRQVVCCGGQMATALSTCLSFGLRARYVGVTGTDENGRRIRSELASRGIDLTDAVIRDVPNQFAVIIVDESSGERIVLWDRDEGLLLKSRELPTVTSDLDRLTERTEELVAAVTIPIFAEHLALQLSGESDHERALRKIRRRHDGLLVTTIGAQGAVVLEGDRFLLVPGFAVDAVDTTGSGDVFRGGFIYGLLSGWPIERTVRFANAAAAVSCTRLGAINGVPTLEDVQALLERR